MGAVHQLRAVAPPTPLEGAQALRRDYADAGDRIAAAFVNGIIALYVAAGANTPDLDAALTEACRDLAQDARRRLDEAADQAAWERSLDFNRECDNG